MKCFKSLLLNLFFAIICTSCAKEWLEVKKDQKLVVPVTLEDYQAMLDNRYVFNIGVESDLGELSSDDIFCKENDWKLASDIYRSAYIWSPDLVNYYSQSNINDWSTQYQKVFYANVILDRLNKDPQPNNISWSNIVGQAYFWRAWAFFQLAQIYSEPYDVRIITNQKGIPLPLNSDINNKHEMSSLSDSYKQMEADALQGILYLSEGVNNYNRPSLEAAYGLLCRIYLQKGDYLSCFKYASEALKLTKPLINYNTVNSVLNYPFVEGNQEVILNTTMTYSSSGLLVDGKMLIDTSFFESYDNLDKRKSIFFKKSGDYYTFRGTYSGGIRLFAGISVDEIYLNYLESAARLDRLEISDNRLKEWINCRYDPTYNINFLTKNNVLEFIMMERRKQTVFRGLRWMDIRRLNTQFQENVIPVRNLDNIMYKMSDYKKNYSFEIPKNVLEFNKLL